jgi:hypothetical protein
MKTFLLIRFDKLTSSDTADEILVALSDMIEINNIQAIKTPSTDIFIFKSEYKHKEIYIALGKIKPVVAFFLIDVSDVDFCIHMPEQITKVLMEFLGKNYINKAEYSEDLSLKELQKSLQDAVEDQNYELAAEIRDKISNKQTK